MLSGNRTGMNSTTTLGPDLMSKTEALPTNSRLCITLYDSAVSVAKSKDYCLLIKIVMTGDSGLLSNCLLTLKADITIAVP